MARKPPRELIQGLDPIKVGILRADYVEACRQEVARRGAELSRRLEVLREWYEVAPGPDSWRELCLAMAAERFPGFRERAGRKPQKWTMGVLWALAGEMRRTLDAGAESQELAAQQLASREPWKGFLSKGRWRGKAAPRGRGAWENALSEYTHMPERYRTVGEDAYLMYSHDQALGEWDRLVRDLLERPSAQ